MYTLLISKKGDDNTFHKVTVSEEDVEKHNITVKQILPDFKEDIFEAAPFLGHRASYGKK